MPHSLHRTGSQILCRLLDVGLSMVSGWTFGSTFNTTTNNNNNANNNTSMSDIGNGSYQFANGDVISLNDWPPAPVAWLYNAVDLLCVPLQCAHTWRGPISMLLRTIGSGTTDDNGQESWLSEHYRIPSITQHIPPLLSYDEFRGRDVLSSADEDDNWYYSPDALYRFAFSTSSTSLGRLSTPTAFAVLCLLTLTLRTIKAVLLPAFAALGHKAALRSHGEAWIQANQIRMVKFGEYVFRLLYHSVISVYGLWCFHDKQWWKPGQTISVFQGYPLHDIEPGMAWYYLLQSAYNVEAFLSLMQMSIVVKPQWIRQQNRQHQRHQHPWQWPIAVAWSSTVRGDFQEMCIHHIVTNVLVFGSSALHFTRIGSMVFLVHDVSDVPVDLSKLANFLKWKWTTVCCFLTMAVTWAYTRLYILPRIIYWTMITQSHYVLEENRTPVLSYVCYRHLFYFFLGLLIALHAAWFAMFLKMLHTLVIKNEAHDYSEHKGGEPSHTATTSNSSNGISIDEKKKR